MSRSIAIRIIRPNTLRFLLFYRCITIEKHGYSENLRKIEIISVTYKIKIEGNKTNIVSKFNTYTPLKSEFYLLLELLI